MKNKNTTLKRKILLIFSFVLATCAGIYILIINAGRLYDMMFDRISSISEFKLKSIEITGANPKIINIIRKRIHARTGNSILNISGAEVYNHIKNISWVKSALVKKRLPNIIKIEINEAIPIAIYQQNAKSILIDSEGQYLEEVSEKPAELPLVSGKNANKMVSEMLDTISKFRDIRERLEMLTYVRERRWDITISGIKVKLPEYNVEKALEMLDHFIKDDRMSKNNINSIDLRIRGQITINGIKVKRTL